MGRCMMHGTPADQGYAKYTQQVGSLVVDGFHVVMLVSLFLIAVTLSTQRYLRTSSLLALMQSKLDA